MLITSWGHVTSLLQFILIFASDAENASYVFQYIVVVCWVFLFFFTKQIPKICYKSNTLMPSNDL